MKKLLLSGAALLSLAVAEKVNAQAWSQNFNSGIPANWVLINNDNKTPAFTGAFATQLATKAWAGISRAAGDSAVGTTSWFTPAGQADRWMITHSFQVTSASMYLVWEDYAPDANYADSVQILVSPTAGTTTSAFTATIYNQKGATTGFVAHAISLGTYNGQTIRLAFRDHSTDQNRVYVDNFNVAVLPAVDAALTNLAPTAGSPTSYGIVGGGITFSAVVHNYGSSPLTSYNLKYQVGTGAVVSQAVTGNIASFGSANVTFSTPYTVPAANNYNVKAWVEATGDVNHINDSAAATTITGVTFMPKKKLMFEEATGTWCGWCVRGMVYMDSIWKTHSADVSAVAVHNDDPMLVSAYDTKLGQTPGFSGYPSVVVDRREIIDPSEIFAAYNGEKDYFGFADITLGTATYSGSNVTIPVTVKPAISLSGDYRLSLVLSEDGVHGTTDHTQGVAFAWDQHNYYAGQANSGNYVLPSSGTYGDFHTKAAYVPANAIHYDFVARSISNASGDASSLPASMTAGTNYTYTYTAPVNAAWDRTKLRATVMMIRASDGQVLNTANSRFALGLSNVSAGISKFSVFPNPANANASARIELSQASSVAVEVVDVMGRVVVAIPAAQMGAGEHIVTLPVANLSSGIYNVKIITTGGSLTERLSIVK